MPPYVFYFFGQSLNKISIAQHLSKIIWKRARTVADGSTVLAFVFYSYFINLKYLLWAYNKLHSKVIPRFTRK